VPPSGERRKCQSRCDQALTDEFDPAAMRSRRNELRKQLDSTY
jgi:hypothetical protein